MTYQTTDTAKQTAIISYAVNLRKYLVTIIVNTKNKGIIKAELSSLQNVKE